MANIKLEYSEKALEKLVNTLINSGTDNDIESLKNLIIEIKTEKEKKLTESERLKSQQFYDNLLEKINEYQALAKERQSSVQEKEKIDLLQKYDNQMYEAYKKIRDRFKFLCSIIGSFNLTRNPIFDEEGIKILERHIDIISRSILDYNSAKKEHENISYNILPTISYYITDFNLFEQKYDIFKKVSTEVFNKNSNRISVELKTKYLRVFKNIDKIFEEMLEDKEKFKEIKRKIETKYGIDSSKEELIRNYKNELTKLYTEMYNDQIKNIAMLKSPFADSEVYEEKIKAIFQKYNTLSDDEKNRISESIEQRILFECGNNFVLIKNDIKNIIELFEKQILTKLTKLENIKPNTQEFIDAYNSLEINIKSFISRVNDIDNGMTAHFDNITQTLTIEFNNPKLEPFKKQLINPKNLTIKQDNIQRAERVEEQISNSNNEEMIIAQNQYIAKIERINDLINTINLIHLELENIDPIIFSGDDIIDRYIAKEQELRRVMDEVQTLKLELSNARLNYLARFNLIIYSIPKIRALKINEFAYSDSLEAYIEFHDNLIINAERQIIELDKMRNMNSLEVTQITSRIKKIISFIEVQNTLIGNRLVYEAQVNKVNIMEILKQRRIRKKALREKLSVIANNAEEIHNVDISQESNNFGQEIIPKPEHKIINRKLRFNPAILGQINVAQNLIINSANPLVVQKIKNGIKVTYSQDLSKKLKDLKAKISLVNKNNRRMKKSQLIEGLEQNIAFKKHDIEDGNYQIEISVPVDDNKTTTIFEQDIESSKLHM